MSLPKQFISCDWGTSNFRLRLVDSETLQILSEHKTDVGVKVLYQEFSAQKELDQQTYFANYLMKQIKQLEAPQEVSLIVACGMITASIGMVDLPYADMPLQTDGSNLLHKTISLNEQFDIILVSGAKTVADVMRGEEVQAVGLSKHIDTTKEGILLLPGTHSKHINFNNGSFNDFTTYMTGEMFDIISKQSILAGSLSVATWSEAFKSSFLDGVTKAVNGEQLSSLFSIRANSLFAAKTNEENFYFLSGLMIGGELAYLKNTSAPIYLAAAGILNELYQLALDSFLPKEQITCLEKKLIEEALLIGQQQILQKHA